MLTVLFGLFLAMHSAAQVHSGPTGAGIALGGAMQDAVLGSVPSKIVRRIVFIGDSLTQGYGVRTQEAFPEVVGEILKSRGYNVTVVNGGISGSVTAEADQRVRWYLKVKPEFLFLALGANDALQGAPTKVVESNLERALGEAARAKLKVILAGIKIFTNFGEDYVREFDAIYPRLAKRHGLPFMPFLLEGVALKKELNQTDMRHPNAQGHRVIAENIAKIIEPLLKVEPK